MPTDPDSGRSDMALYRRLSLEHGFRVKWTQFKQSDFSCTVSKRSDILDWLGGVWVRGLGCALGLPSGHERRGFFPGHSGCFGTVMSGSEKVR